MNKKVSYTHQYLSRTESNSLYTSEMSVEHTSLRMAKAENNVDEIAVLMSELWEQAKTEYKATVSAEKLTLMEKAEKAANLNELEEIFFKIYALEF